MAMSHEETIKTKLYQNWIKSGLGLKYLKEGLQPFVTQVIKDQHKKFVERLQPCSSCSLGTLLPDHALKVGRNCSLGCDKCLCIGSKRTIRTRCQSNVCGKIYDKIVMSHFFADPNFSNTDITKWVEDQWELAKCYINAWGYKDKKSAEDTDCLGILSIVINDKEFYSLVDPATKDICTKVRTYRNDIMHSSNLEVEDANLRTYIEDMIAILNDPNQLKDDRYAEAARTQLQKLLDKEFYISTSDEISVIREAQRSLERNNEVQASCLNDLIQNLDQVKKGNREQVQDCLKKAMDDLNNKVNDQQKLAADIEQIKKDLESLKTELKDNCIQKIQDILQRLESEKLKKAEDKLKEHLKYLEDKNRLKEKLFEMYEKHLSTRPISPVLEEVCAHVGDIYVDLVICDHILKEQHENRTQKKICVERYKDIFFRNDKQCFDIYMLGDAGMGKTTWCVKLVNDWVKVSKNKFDETRNSDLQCFEVVMLVFLRNATEEVKILDMIKEQLFAENTDYYDILTSVLKQEPQKCLVIADGLDEWKMLNKHLSVSVTQSQNIPSKAGLNGCPLLVTSRISAIYDIRLKENQFDRCVKIEGIKETGKLAAKIINELNKLSDDKVKKQFKDFHEAMEQIRLKPLIASLPFADKTPVSQCMNVPLLLIISVCTWFNYGKLEPTLAGIYCEMFKYLFDYTRSMKKYEFSSPIEKATAETEVSSLPKELKERIPPQCVELLLKMSQFAFDRLFEDCEENPQKLLFDEVILRKWFSLNHLQAAIKSGILSKSIHVNQPLKRTASMSFLHKSFQEFLSAVYIVSQFQLGKMEPFVVFQKYCCSYEKLTEMENVLLFVCGFDPQAASQMSLHVLTIAKEILKTETKSSDIQKSDYLIKHLPLKCTIQVHENNEDYPSAEYPIHIETLSLSLNDISRYFLSDHIKYIYKMLTSNISKLIKVDVHLDDEKEFVILQWRPFTVGGLKRYYSPQPYRVEVDPLLQHCELPFLLKECALEYLDLSQFSVQQLKAFGKSLKQLTKLESLKLINVNYSSSITLSLHNCRLRSLKLIDTNIVVKANIQDLKNLEVKNCSVKLFKEFACWHDHQILRIHHSSHAEFYPDTINQMFLVFLLIPETKLNVENNLFENKFVNKNTNLSKIDTMKNFRPCIQYMYNEYYNIIKKTYAVTYRHDNMQTNEMEQFLSLLDIYSISRIQHVDFVFKDMNVNIHEKTLTDFLRKCETSEVEFKNTSLQDSGDGRKCIQLRNYHLTITNNSVLETRNILKCALSTESITSLSFCNVIIEHGLLAHLFSTKHLTYLKIILSRQQNPVFEATEVDPLLEHCELPFLLKECALEYLDLSQFSALQLKSFEKSVKQLTKLEYLKIINVNYSSSITLNLHNCRLRSLKLIDTNIVVKANIQDLKNLEVKNCSVKLFKEFACGHNRQILRIHHSSHAEFYPDTINQMFSVFHLIPETKLNVENNLFENKFVNKNTNLLKIDTMKNFRSCIQYMYNDDNSINKKTYAVTYRHDNMQTNEMEQFLSLLDIYSISKVQHVDFVFKDMNVNVHEKTLTDFLRKCEISEVELKNTNWQDSDDDRKRIHLCNYHLTITNNSVLETQNILEYTLSTESIKSLSFCTDIIENELLAHLFSTMHLTYLKIILSRQQNTVFEVPEDWNRQQNNRASILLQQPILTCLNTTKQETQNCVKLAASNFDIRLVKITTDYIDDETIAIIFENNDFETCEIELLKGEIPLVKVLETMMNENTCAHRRFIRLKDNRVRFELQCPRRNYFKTSINLSCLKATNQETQHFVKLSTSNYDIKSVQITTDFIDDETIASLLECKHFNSVRIEVLQGEVSLVKVIETMINAQTLISFCRLFQKRRGCSEEERMRKCENRLQLEYENMLEIRSNRGIITLQVDDMCEGLLLTCLNSTVEETRYACQLVKSNNAIVSVNVLTQSIDDKTFADLIACDHLEELSLSIIEVTPNQREKLSNLLKDSKFRHVYDHSNGNWKITSQKKKYRPRTPSLDGNPWGSHPSSCCLF